MGTVTQEISSAADRHAAQSRLARMPRPSPRRHWPLPHVALLLGLWAAIFVGSLSTPALLDDADATHAQAAQAMLQTGDWVTLHVNGVRYLEKAPLPYWIAAASLWAFQAQGPAHGARAAFAIHLPLALTVLALAWLGYGWARRAFGSTAALYTGIFVLTSAGVFLFTRIFIPDAMLSLWLALALWSMLRALESPDNSRFAYLLWTSLALAVLSKGLVALVFIFGTAAIFLLLTRDWRNLRRLRPAQYKRRKRARVLLVLFRERTRIAFSRSAHSAGLQQTAGVSLLAAAWCVAVSVELFGSSVHSVCVAAAA